MDDFDIEIYPESQSQKSDIQLPINYISFGEIESDDIRVYIKQEVYNKLEEYASTDINHELGTILIGDYVEEHDRLHIIISDYIYAKYTDASASTLTFTHQTWDYIYKIKENDYPDKKIIGWQHTHPGYGIFLSNYDMFIQENFFNLRFQVAYVIDPVQHIRGFFQWKNGNVEKLHGFYLYDDQGKKIKTNFGDTDIDRGEDHRQNEKSRTYLKSGILLSLLAILFVFNISILSRINKINKKNEELKNTVSEQAELIDGLDEKLKMYENTSVYTSSDENESVEELDNDIQEEESITDSVVSLPSSDNEPEGELVYLQEYIVIEGDTLVSICEKNNIDYYVYSNYIVSSNGLKSTDEIYVGQVILLPKHE